MKICKSVLVVLLTMMTILFFYTSVSYAKSYAQSMVSLVNKIKQHTKQSNSNFIIVANGGYNLYAPKAKTKDKMLRSVDGVIIEDAFTNKDRKKMQKCLRQAILNNNKAMSIEYKSFSGKRSIVSYNAKGNKNLNKIPSFVCKTKYDVSKLQGAKNFIVILDPDKYKTKKKYLQTLKNTDYDLIFMDLFYKDKALTNADVKSLKIKRNGGKRIVCSYLSIGEAEDYRYYWKKKWNKKSKRPKWICKENKEWDGNYKVRYWNKHWQRIVYQYADKIVGAGFDGVYLDVIDAYEYFE